MNFTIELPNDVAAAVESTAGAEGLSTCEWISKEIVARLASKPQSEKQPTRPRKTMADLLPLIGQFEGKPGTEHLSENGREAFIEHLVKQHESYGRDVD